MSHKFSEHTFAVALIRKSEPHYHKDTEEYYYVTEGIGTLFTRHLGSDIAETVHLMPGEHVYIPSETIHWVESEHGIKLEVIAAPGYDPEDHHIVEG